VIADARRDAEPVDCGTAVNWELVVDGPGVEKRRYSFPSSAVVTVGRDPSSDIVLVGKKVSRTHARVSLDEEHFLVEDISINGTRAGDRQLLREVAQVPLGTPLVIGEFSLRMQVVGPERPGDLRPLLPVSLRPETPVAPFCPPAVPSVENTVMPGPSPVAVDRGMDPELRRRAHRLLLEHLDLAALLPSKGRDPSLRPNVLAALGKVVERLNIPRHIDRAALIADLADEALGLGPLERFLSDPSVTEIMVVDADTIFVERMGVLTRADARFTDDERVRAVIERIVTPLGRRIDESSPFVDARLPDGSRVNAVIRPIALKGSCITIRKFAKNRLKIDDLIRFGALTEPMARFLRNSVIAKKNIVVAGGTGSGKTTLLNILSEAIPPEERIITIEDAAELQLVQPHVVSLETRPPNMEGKGGYTVRDLVKNALRMRPDRIVVGECRGGEALDMLQAMNTGHEGSLTTTHANSPREAIARLETLVLMAGLDLPSRAIREQIASAVHLLVQQTRLSDGSRKVTAIAEVTGLDDEGQITVVPLFEFARNGTGPGGKILGEFRSTGFLPTFLSDFEVMGLSRPGESFL
jgi:pilus assembly protein CpaF